MVIVALGGCAHRAEAPPARRDTPPAVAAPALTLLRYARRLSQTTPAGREQAVRTARRQVQASPSAFSYAYLALALGAPHQRLYTPDEAARYAQLALDSKPSPWDANARQYLIDYARLYGELSRPDAEHNHDDQRIADLQKRLHKAQQKLKALSTLEDHLDNVENSP